MQIEFEYRFEAAHRFLKSESVPCMTPHGHTWYATMGLAFKGSNLSSSQMTVEFTQLKKSWKTLIQETFDHSYMHNINDPVVEVLTRGEQEPRLIPFPGDPTTEMISLFMFKKMDTLLKGSDMADKVEVNFIRLKETPTNTIVCDKNFFLDEISQYDNYSGWWTSNNPLDRSFKSESATSN